eukprot:721007-Amphidinium_carterae.2
MPSILLRTFCPHAEEGRRQYVTVTGEGLNISGWKETTMVTGKILVQVKFVVANVQSPLIGLHDIDFNEIVMHTGNEPYIEQYGYNEQAMRIGSHMYVAAMVLLGLHNHEEVRVASSIRTRYPAASQSQLILGEVQVIDGCRDLHAVRNGSIL